MLQTFGKEGDIAKVHATLVSMEVEGPAAAQPAQSAPSSSVPAQGAPTLPAQHAGEPAPLQTAGAPQARGAAAPTTHAGGGNGDSAQVLATPVTRRMAREMGVDLASLQGTGPQGRVMKADVLAHTGNRGQAPLPAPARARPPRAEPAAADEVRALRGLRKSIAKSMVQSHTYAVPFTFVEECDTAALTALRKRINKGLSASAARRSSATCPSSPRRSCAASPVTPS